MNFEDAIKTINKDYCNLFYAKYLQGLWKMVVGYRTVPEHIAILRKELADWQISNDCSNTLCIQSRSQSITVISYGSKAPLPNDCVLNPPLQPFGVHSHDHNWPGNVNEILVGTFVKY